MAAISCASAKPGLLPVAYSAPLVAAPAVVTAQSSQVFARNYNGIAAAPIIAAPAPIAAYTSYAAAPVAAYTSYAAAPLAYSAYSAYPAPIATSLKYTIF